MESTICDTCIYKDDCDGLSISAQTTKELCIAHDYELYEEYEGEWLIIEFNIKKNSRGYIITRVDGEYSQHAHLSTRDGCNRLLNLIENKLLPNSKYLQESCRRLLTDDEYAKLRQKKQMYYNVNKGVRKWNLNQNGENTMSQSYH